MDITWTLGVLSAGAENVQPLTGGTAATRGEAAEAASDALVSVAMDRGRQEYRVRVADTLLVVIPGLTKQGDVDLSDLAATVPRFERARSERIHGIATDYAHSGACSAESRISGGDYGVYQAR